MICHLIKENLSKLLLQWSRIPNVVLLDKVWRSTFSSSQCHGDSAWWRERADCRGYGRKSAGAGSAPGSDLEDQRRRIGRLLARPAQQRQLQRGGVLKVPGLTVTVKSYVGVYNLCCLNIENHGFKCVSWHYRVTHFAKTKQKLLENARFHCMM